MGWSSSYYRQADEGLKAEALEIVTISKAGLCQAPQVHGLSDSSQKPGRVAALALQMRTWKPCQAASLSCKGLWECPLPLWAGS